MDDTNSKNRRLTTEDHSRDSAQLLYVYPVVSRRARGVSVGVNLNPNSACNWACVYCQVPDLVRGAAPTIDGSRLEDELRGFLSQVTTPEWMEAHAPPESRRINDIAFSGNGEPTTAKDFDDLVRRVLSVRAEFPAMRDTKTVLITNGSQVHQPHVLRGLEQMAAANGEVWFKIDSATREGRSEINGIDSPLERVTQNLRASAAACRTLVQTCAFGRDGEAPTEVEVDAYVQLLKSEVERGTPIAGVLLYGLARPSLQPGAARLSRLDEQWMLALKSRIEAATDLSVDAHA